MLIRGDARAVPLRDECVECVVTSPPYWGLRDYGTATWVGGGAGCAHTIGRMQHLSAKQASNAGASRDSVAGVSRCRICGAERVDAQIGLEASATAYVETLVAVFREVRRVLKPDGTCWLNLGDSYATAEKGGYQPNRVKAEDSMRRGNLAVGLLPKNLVGMPWRVAFALQADGWYLRSDIIWSKPNPMPESVTDRPTKSHEYVFLLAKSERYDYDAAAIAEYGAGRERFGNSRSVDKAINPDRHDSSRRDMVIIERRNRRSVWTVTSEPYAGAHFATMPEALVEPCILAGCPLGGLVLDPFCGTGTVVAVAERFGRRGIGIDLAYQDLAKERTAQRGLDFGTEWFEVTA